MAWWKAVAREPLVHFVLLGAALFALDAARSEPERIETPAADGSAATTSARDTRPAGSIAGVPGEARSIDIDAETRAAVTARAERRLGHPPSAAEHAAELERWIDEEILYREALARGLERGDPVIRERIASRMLYVLEQSVIVPEPSEAELRAWFDAHRATWDVPERVDFTHVFVASSDAARADELARRLASGAAPETLGDRFTGGHRYRGRRVADLADAFGDDFAAGLAQQPPGSWQRRRSRHGLHLVRVDRVEPARPADFAAARLDVRKAWLDAHRTDAVGAAVRKLRDGWRVVSP